MTITEIPGDFIAEGESHLGEGERGGGRKHEMCFRRRVLFSETVPGHLNARVTNRLCHGGVSNKFSSLLNGRCPPIFVSDVTKPFPLPGFSARRAIILAPPPRNTIAISKNGRTKTPASEILGDTFLRMERRTENERFLSQHHFMRFSGYIDDRVNLVPFLFLGQLIIHDWTRPFRAFSGPRDKSSRPI